MKISIPLTCFLLAWSHFLMAQTVGIRAGLSIASQVWKFEDVKVRPGFLLVSHVGLTLNFGESEKVSGQLEISYSQFGFGKYSDSTGAIGSQRIDYIKIGCAIKYHPKENINVHVGPELGFGFRDVKDLTHLAAPDFGAFAGIEYYFTTYIGVGGRYFLGFSDTNDNPQLKQFNRAFQISILIRFNGRQLKESGY